MNKIHMAGAPLAMRQRGGETDAEVLREVKQTPGATIHDIAERLNWSNGRVDGSVNRLVSQEKVKVRHVIRKGTLVKEVFPAEFTQKPCNLVEIPRNMVNDNLWKETVHMYALSRTTIALAPERVEEWDKKAFKRQKLLIRKNSKSMEIMLPNSISDFYQLDNSETSLSTTGNLALVTVESTVMPVALPPAYPAEAMYKFTRILFVEQFEGIASYAPVSKVDLTLREGEGEAKQIPIPSEFYRPRVTRRTERMRTLTGSTGSIEIPVMVK